jgi:hypothetical protein
MPLPSSMLCTLYYRNYKERRRKFCGRETSKQKKIRRYVCRDVE